jgi:hypothetical protein
MSLYLNAGTYVAISLMSACVAVVFLQVSGIDAWRHDEIYYLPDGSYIYNIKENGRWLNHLVSGILLTLPGMFWWFVGYAGFATFCYTVARQVNDRLYAIALALLFLQAPAFISQSFWPALVAPSLVLLGAFSVLSRRARPAVLFPVAAVTLFASYPAAYFLLPLLYLERIKASGKPIVSTIAMLVIWAASFLLGYLVASTVNYFVFGQFAFEVAAWRDPHHVQSFSDLVENVGSRFAWFRYHTRELLSSAYIWTPVLTGFALRFLTKSDIRFVLSVVVVSACCLLAQYVVTLPIGVVISERSLIAFCIAPLAVGFLQTPTTVIARAVLVGLIVPPFFVNWSLSLDEIRYFSRVNEAYRVELERALPRAAETYSGIVLWDGNVSAFEAEIVSGLGLRRTFDETLAANFRWAPAARAAGFPQVVLCEAAPDFCASRIRPEALKDCVGALGFYCVRGVTDDEYLIVSFVEPRQPS